MLPLEVRQTGYGLLEQRLAALMAEIHDDRYRPVLPAEIVCEPQRERSNPRARRARREKRPLESSASSVASAVEEQQPGA